jgi:hypothetical protein
MKLVPYFALGQFSPRTLATSVVLLPFAIASNFFGLWLARRTPTELFYQITYLLMFLISLALIWKAPPSIPVTNDGFLRCLGTCAGANRRLGTHWVLRGHRFEGC